MKFSKSWLVPAVVGVGLGYLFSHTISGLVAQTGLPIHAMQGRMRPHPVHPVHPVHPAHPAPHMTYVPVRRSFDRSYDSWLHTTVNSLPPIG